MKLLLIEDEPLLVDNLKTRLQNLGYLVDIALDGIEGTYALQEFQYDVIVLDLGLPYRPGLKVLTELRQGTMRLNMDTPVLILTARNTWQERVQGLKIGANDYLGKPFQFEELVVRIEVLLRRSQGQKQVLSVGQLELNLLTKQLLVKTDSPVVYDLTLTEFRLLQVLMQHPNQIFSKSDLLSGIGNQDYEGESNIIEVYIRKLRKMVGKETIETSRGLGYKIVV